MVRPRSSDKASVGKGMHTVGSNGGRAHLGKDGGRVRSMFSAVPSFRDGINGCHIKTFKVPRVNRPIPDVDSSHLGISSCKRRAILCISSQSITTQTAMPFPGL